MGEVFDKGEDVLTVAVLIADSVHVTLHEGEGRGKTLRYPSRVAQRFYDTDNSKHTQSVFQNGPCPRHEVVVSAVIAAVSMATITSTALRLISAHTFSRIESNTFIVVRILESSPKPHPGGAWEVFWA